MPRSARPVDPVEGRGIGPASPPEPADRAGARCFATTLRGTGTNRQGSRARPRSGCWNGPSGTSTVPACWTKLRVIRTTTAVWYRSERSKAAPDHGEALGGRGGLEPGHLEHRGEGAGVLVVLRAVAAGVVAQQDDQAAVHGRQVQRHQRVDQDVHADALGADQRPTAGDRGADADLHGHLLVARPLDVQTVRPPPGRSGRRPSRSWASPGSW